MIYYITPILFIAGIIFFPVRKNHKIILYENYIILCLTIFCILLSGLRYETGSDWETYNYVFKNAEDYLNSHFEQGYTLLNYILSFFNVDYNIFLLLIGSLYALMYYFLVPFAYNKWIFSLFLYSNTYVLFMGGNRQAISLVLGCIGTIYFFGFKRFTGLLYWLLALQFHLSSILIPVTTIVSKFFKPRFVILVALILNLIVLINNGVNPLANIISNLLQGLDLLKFSAYIEGQEYLNQNLDYGFRNIIILLSNSITLFSFIVFRDKLIKMSPQNKFFLIISSIFYAIFALFIGVSQNASGRSLIYGRPFEAIIISYLPYAISSKLIKKIAILFIVVSMLVKTYFTFITQGFYLPYQGIF